MSVIESLISGAKADADVLSTLSSHGDNFSIGRDVDFTFHTQSAQKAERLQQFVNDNCYGSAFIESLEGDFRILVRITTPIQQPIIFSISGFMACLGTLFDVEYDGWGCPVKRGTQ
jgi:hypothetical protein